MQKSSFRDRISSYLYEISVCPICLEDLSSNISSLKCGHCFHSNCLQRHLKESKFCPNCRKKSLLKEMRSVYFQIVRSSKEHKRIIELIPQLDPSVQDEVKQIVQHFKEELSHFNEMKDKIDEQECEMLTMTNKLVNAEVEITGLQILKIENEELKWAKFQNQQKIIDYQSRLSAGANDMLKIKEEMEILKAQKMKLAMQNEQLMKKMDVRLTQEDIDEIKYYPQEKTTIKKNIKNSSKKGKILNTKSMNQFKSIQKKDKVSGLKVFPRNQSTIKRQKQRPIETRIIKTQNTKKRDTSQKMKRPQPA